MLLTYPADAVNHCIDIWACCVRLSFQAQDSTVVSGQQIRRTQYTYSTPSVNAPTKHAGAYSS